MCLCDNIGLVALILLGWELRASSITVLCVEAVMILSPLLFMPFLYSHSNSKNFYITCILLTEEGSETLYTKILTNLPGRLSSVTGVAPLQPTLSLRDEILHTTEQAVIII